MFTILLLSMSIENPLTKKIQVKKELIKKEFNSVQKFDIGKYWFESIKAEAHENQQKVDKINEEYYQRTGEKPNWEMPY